MRPAPVVWFHRGSIVDVVSETATFPDGRTAELEIVRHPGGSAVVALNTQNEVCLLRQYRHAVGGWLWELPAGRRDNGEEPLQTARRELAEETGLEAQEWDPLGSVVSSPGVFTEIVHLFRARSLTTTVPAREALEYIEIHWVPLAEATAWATNGRITDAKTAIGLFRAQSGG